MESHLFAPMSVGFVMTCEIHPSARAGLRADSIVTKRAFLDSPGCIKSARITILRYFWKSVLLTCVNKTLAQSVSGFSGVYTPSEAPFSLRMAVEGFRPTCATRVGAKLILCEGVFLLSTFCVFVSSVLCNAWRTLFAHYVC